MRKLISTAEIAALLNISRIAVFKRIKNGEIKAEKIGRNYVIEYKEAERLLGKRVDAKEKIVLQKGVSRVIREYGEALRKLSKE